MAQELRSFDRVAHVYDETRSMPPHVSQAVTDALLAALRDLASEPRLLEIGIGTGRIAVPLAAAGVRVAGIDISASMLIVLRGKRTDLDVMFAEAARLPFGSHVFDAALFVHILHLIPDPEGTIRETLRVVRPGGLILHGGGDIDTVQNDADIIISNANKELTGVDAERRDREAVARQQALFSAVDSAGGVVRRIEVATWVQTTTGAAMLQRQRNRDYSASWTIPGEAHAAFIERIERELSELPGGLDATIEHEQNFVLTVGRLP